MRGNFYRKSDIWSNICLSLLIILVSNPYNIRNNGVLLSYGGTIGIICFLGIFNKKSDTKENLSKKFKNYIKGIFFVSFSAQIVILPILAYSYKTISFTFFVTNILTSFLIGMIIIFGFIIVLISFINLKFAILFGTLYKLLIDILQIITEHTSKIPFSKIYVKTPYLIEIVLYYAIIFGIYYCIKQDISIFKIIRNKYKKVIAVILVIILVVSLIYVETQRDLKIYFIDVGQGDSCLIITPENTKIIIDGGGSETYDVGENVLLPYLLSRRITKIDYIVCSHFDTDHCGSLKTVLENLKVKNLVISKQKEEYENFKEIMKIANRKKVNVVIVKANDKIALDKSAYIKILYPTKELPHSDINNNSIVAKFVSQNTSILFTRRYRKGS